jgi:hypothetical protein
VLLHLAHEVVGDQLRIRALLRLGDVGQLDADRAVDLGQLVGEDGLDDDALDLLDAADVLLAVGRGGLSVVLASMVLGSPGTFEIRSAPRRHRRLP